MLADHAVEHRRALPFGDSLPEPPDQRGIGLSPFVPGDEPTPFTANQIDTDL